MISELYWFLALFFVCYRFFIIHNGQLSTKASTSKAVPFLMLHCTPLPVIQTKTLLQNIQYCWDCAFFLNTNQCQPLECYHPPWTVRNHPTHFLSNIHNTTTKNERKDRLLRTTTRKYARAAFPFHQTQANSRKSRNSHSKENVYAALFWFIATPRNSVENGMPFFLFFFWTAAFIKEELFILFWTT